MPSDPIRRAPRLLAPVIVSYARRLRRFGAAPQGVFWRSLEGQRLRFEVLVRLFAPETEAGGVSVTDFGCGYGAFFDFLKDRPEMRNGRYYGYDACKDMVVACRDRIRDERATFEHSLVARREADYSFVSGTYNLKLDADPGDWLEYVQASLEQLWSHTRLALAFNMLTIEAESKEDGLYYADPRVLFDFSARRLSSNVSLINDYSPIEFTIQVRR